MWDRHSHTRAESRKRAMRAARERAARKGRVVEAVESSGDHAKATKSGARDAPDPEWSESEDEEPPVTHDPEDDPPERRRHDPAASLAWTSLILLAVILIGVMLTFLFMLG